MTDEQKKQEDFLKMIKEMLDELEVKYMLTFKFPELDNGECINGSMINASIPEMLRFVEMIEELTTAMFEKKMN